MPQNLSTILTWWLLHNLTRLFYLVVEVYVLISEKRQFYKNNFYVGSLIKATVTALQFYWKILVRTQCYDWQCYPNT